MHNAVLAAVAAVLCGVIIFARLRAGFVVVVAATLLVPGSLLLRNPITPYALFTRVLIVVLALRLGVEIWRGSIDRSVLRWTTVHTGFVVFLVATFIAGVALADSAFTNGGVTAAYLLLLDQFLFFVVMLACVRVIGSLPWCLGVVAIVLLMSAGIGLIEHATHGSWGHFLFGRIVAGVVGSDPLTMRLDNVRVRAGAEYPLQYGWVLAMMLPALVAWLATLRLTIERWLPIAVTAIGVVVVAEYWSYSRTSFAAIGLAALFVALAAREQRILVMTGVGLGLGVILFVAISGLQHGFVGLASGPVDVRTARLPLILQIGAMHPLHGIGFGGLAAMHLPNTDSSYLQLYGETGLLGLVSGVALVCCATACCARGLWSRSMEERLAAAAAVVAGLVMLVSGIAYDALRSLSSSRPFWLVIAIGVVAAEHTAGPLPALVRHRRRVLAGGLLVAAAVGVLMFVLAPVHYARQYQFQTVSAAREVQPDDPVTVGTTFINSVCTVVGGVGTEHHEASFDCSNPQLAAGVGVLRVEAASAVEVQQLVHDVQQSVGQLPLSFALAAQTPLASGRDTALAWAPFWVPGAVLLGLVLLPVTFDRRRR